MEQEQKGKIEMAQQRLGIIMNGVTGRMGMNQHLIRSILAIRAQGGVALKNGDRVMPDPILVGRNEAKLAQLAKAHGLTRWTSDLNAALKNREDTLFFDAATTELRAKLLRKAITAARTFIARSPSPRRSKMPSTWRARPSKRACGTASCRTSSFFLACSSSRC